MAKINWEELKKEFILGEYKSLKEFAEKQGLKYNSDLRSHASGWKKDKQTKHRQKADKIVSKTIEKIADKEATKLSKALSTELEAADLISKLVLKTLGDKQQFNRHLVQRKEKSSDGECFDERWWVEEETFDVVDTRRLKDLSAALTSSSQLKKTILGLLSEAEKQHLDIEREKLALEKSKANLPGDEDDETGVVILPDIEEGGQGADITKEDS